MSTSPPQANDFSFVRRVPGKWQVNGDELRLLVNDVVQKPTADEIYALMLEGETRFRGIILDLKEITPEELFFSRKPAFLVVSISYNENVEGCGLSLAVNAVCGDSSVQIDNLRGRSADHLVTAGRWYPFTSETVSEILSSLEEAGVSDSGPLTLRQYLSLRQKLGSASWLRDETEGRSIHPGINSTLAPDVLVSFTGKLYPYQKAGWQWLTYIWRQGLGAILADEMGLGKTIQVIALLASPEREMASPSLIVAPSTLMENWRREISKFAPGLRTYLHQGSKRTGNYRDLIGHDVVITSYDTVVRDGSLFRMVAWTIVVLDEAQAIKNPDTKRSVSVKKLRRNVGIAVTGTPVENRLRDLWSLVDFIIPGYLGDGESFDDRFPNDLAGANALEPMVSPLMLRRLISEVATDLPARIEIPQVLMLSDEEASEYERIRLETISEYGSNATLVALTRLRMFCAHPMLLDKDDWTIAQTLGFGKFQRLFEIVDEVFASHQKLLVFTSYNRVADLIRRTVRERYGSFAEVVNGGTPIEDRQGVIDQFTSAPGAGLLALNPRAAGTGLNITAATHVVHYNLEWNPAVEDQASARAHRRGQDRPVTIHRLYYADTVEEAVNDRLTRKRELTQTAVVGVEGDMDDYADIMRALQASPVRRD